MVYTVGDRSFLTKLGQAAFKLIDNSKTYKEFESAAKILNPTTAKEKEELGWAFESALASLPYQ